MTATKTPASNPMTCTPAVRTMRVIYWGGNGGQIHVTDPRARREDREATYDVEEMAVEGDFGRCFRVAKHDHERTSYDVRIDGRASACECMSWLRRSTCRHVLMLTAAINAGRMPEGGA